MISRSTFHHGHGAVHQREVGLGLLAAILSTILVGCDKQTELVNRSTPVHVVVAQADTNRAPMTLSGAVVARVESQLAFRVPGRIVERLVDTGATVSRGDVLVRLDDTPFKLAVQEASADLAQMQATLARARRDVERNRALARSGAIAGADFDALETQHANAQEQVRAAQSRLERARNDRSYATLTAPVAGTVALAQAEAGQVVASGTPVLKLARGHENEVQVSVPESRIGQITAGQQAKVRLLSLPDHELIGKVREIASVADPATRTYRVRVALPELPAAARLGMTASVRFDAADNAHGLRLPITALFQQGEQPAVWVLPDNAQHLVLRRVSLAEMGTDTVTVADGIASGERVVVAGVHRLDERMAVQAWDGRLP